MSALEETRTIVWPRYDVGSVTGYKAEVPGSTGRMSTEWYVYDIAFARRIVASFDGLEAEERARHFCRRSNGRYARWLRVEGLR